MRALPQKNTMASFNCPFCGCHSYVFITEPERPDGDKKCIGCGSLYRKGRWKAPVRCYELETYRAVTGNQTEEHNHCMSARKCGNIYFCWLGGKNTNYGNNMKCGFSNPPDQDEQLTFKGW